MTAFMALTTVSAQEDDPILPYQVAPQNLLKFNRFLINPTFSTVREDNSYINLLHRNQSVSFKDNDQTYFLSYSGRVGDKSGLGLSLYNQSVGPVSNTGALANFAYGVKLSDKSNFTFGANLAYYNTGLNRNEIDVVDQNDFRINGTQDSNVLSFQPGFNLSYGQLDFGVFAENLFDYNLKTSKTLTDFKNKTYSAHLQYTYPFKNGSGILESARVMPLARVRMNPQGSSFSEEEQDLSLGGSIILDLPKLGWLQGGYDSFYGASAGAGFNINQRLSLGYTMEKGIGTDFNNLGVTHEISLAYSFTPNLTEDRVMLEDDNEELVDNEELNTDDLASNDELEELKKKAC
jgi:type IX secretion system PorP/SprF family membrane protein